MVHFTVKEKAKEDEYHKKVGKDREAHDDSDSDRYSRLSWYIFVKFFYDNFQNIELINNNTFLFD